MNDFKEWLSDYLRYFMLILAVLLVFALAMIGVKVYQSFNGHDAENAVVILDETEESGGPAVEADTEKKTGSETEEMTESKKDSESETLAETEPESEQETSAMTETLSGRISAEEKKEVSKEPVQETVNAVTETQRTTETQKITETQRITETEPETQTETETEVYVPVYKTLKGSCYIRSGPSMDAEIIGEYMYGTTVEFLEDVGGWYKVRIDGMVGYMGARFF